MMRQYPTVRRWWGRLVRIGALLAAALLLVIGALAYRDAEPLPEVAPGPEGDRLAAAMHAAVGAEAWERTGAVRWGFAGNEHLWDRERSLARVRWGDVSVELDLTSRAGRAWRAGEEQHGGKRDRLLERAYAAWINDSFWLAAHTKAFDEGTSRAAAPVAGGDGLLVRYASGGLTPGDAYLWVLGPDGRPAAWKLWVSVIPVPGVDVSCEDWVDVGTGAWVPTTRRFVGWGLTIRLDDVRGAGTLEQLVPGPDPFERLGYDAPGNNP